jgi:hypothetical protein
MGAPNPWEAAMPDAKPKFDEEALQLLESLKGRRKPPKRAPRKAAASKEGLQPAAKPRVINRGAAGRF